MLLPLCGDERGHLYRPIASLTQRATELLRDIHVDRVRAWHGVRRRQVRFTVGGEELVIDLLLFHLTQLRYVVVKLKIGPFRPDYVGQLGTYVALVDDQVRVRGTLAATVGILLCSARNEQVVRYALSGSRSPMAVAGYTYEALPVEARAALPDAAQLQALLNETTAQLIAHEAADDTDRRGEAGR